MKIAMISQPMAGKSDEEILRTRLIIADRLNAFGYGVVDTLFGNQYDKEAEGMNRPLFYLAKSLEAMARCDAVYFAKDWEQTRGCQIEHQAAVAYGLQIFYE